MSNNRNIRSSGRKSGINPVMINLISEGGENFFRYLKGLGLATERNLMVLSAKRRYYYDEAELGSVRTILNLEKLNMVKHPDRFLNTLFRILPPDSHFIGCFSESGHMKQKGRLHSIISGFLLPRLRKLLGSEAAKYMDKDILSDLFETHGFRIVDMKEMNGLTYFHSRNVRKQFGSGLCK